MAIRFPASSQWAELVAGVLRFSMDRTLNVFHKRKVTAILSKHLDTLTNIDNLATLNKEVKVGKVVIKLIPYLIGKKRIYNFKSKLNMQIKISVEVLIKLIPYLI